MTRSSKAVPPSVPLWFIARPSLEPRLAEIPSRRLTTVVAGPGFGKSTLLGAWAAGVHAAWYTLGPEDEDLPTLAAGLAAALRSAFPDLPEYMADPIIRGIGGDVATERARAEAFGVQVSEEIEEHLTEEGALVLDDVHEIGRRGAGARLIEELVRQAPSSLHLVLASRFEPPFGIERLRGRGDVLSIDGQMLAFSREELARFLELSLKGGGDSLIESLHELTGGWPAAVRLAVEALRLARPEDRERVLSRLVRPGAELFGYLAQEVFAREPSWIREFLRRAALFDRFNVELCQALGIKRAGATIRDLIQRGLFLQERGQDGEWYSLHSLVRDFALRSWPLRPAQVRELHRVAANWFEPRGLADEALRSFASAGDHSELARLLSERGVDLVAGGKAEAIIELGQALPNEFRNASIDLVLGEAYAVRGKAFDALAHFTRAAGDDDPLPIATAIRIGLFHYHRSELDDAARVLERAGSAGANTGDQALLLSTKAAVHYMLGDSIASSSLAARARELAEESQQPQALVAAYTVLGVITRDHRTALPYLERALEAAERGGDIVQLVRIRIDMASTLFAQGIHQEVLDHLDIAIRLAEMAGLDQWLGFALAQRGEYRFALGRPEEAVADLEGARRVYERQGSAEVAYPLTGLGDVHRERGNLALARAHYEEAIAVADAAGDRQRLGPALVGLARLSSANEPEESDRVLELAISHGDAYYHYIQGMLAAGWVALSKGDRDQASRLADQAGARAREINERRGLAESFELKALAAPDPSREAARLEEAIALWREMGHPIEQAKGELALGRLTFDSRVRAVGRRAERALRSLGVRTTPPLAAGLLASLPPEEDAAVRIRTLGGFAVLRRGHVVPLVEWQSKKARDLFKILLARRGHPTPREQLMELLWPEDSPEKSAHRLSVALATLRGVLDPRKEFAQEEFITAGKDQVSLDLSHLPVDVEEFLDEAKAGLSMLTDDGDDAVEILQSAEAAYTGDFLEEDAFEDWAAPLREEARALYISVVGALARSASASGEHETSARYYLRLLERDPYDEGAHLGLVVALVSAGRHGEARRRYRTYASKMQEIDVEAAPFPSAVRA